MKTISSSSTAGFKKILYNGLGRIILYGSLIALLWQFMLWDARQMPTEAKFLENSSTEYLQESLLCLCSFITIYMVLKSESYKYTSLLLLGLFGSSLVREQDNFFDGAIGSWQLPAYTIIAIVVYNVHRHWASLLTELSSYLTTLSFGVFLAGSMTTYVFSRLFGLSVFWEAVMEDRYLRVVKNAGEECVELFGYLLMLFSVIELILLSGSTKKMTLESGSH